MSFLAGLLSPLMGLASRALPAIAGLASRAVPALTRAVAVGKSVLPRVANAIGKGQQMYNTAKAIGKGAHQAIKVVSPDAGKRLEDAYNRKVVGGLSVSDVVERGQKGLAGATGLTNSAKGIFANVIDPALEKLRANTTQNAM